MHFLFFNFVFYCLLKKKERIYQSNKIFIQFIIQSNPHASMIMPLMISLVDRHLIVFFQQNSSKNYYSPYICISPYYVYSLCLFPPGPYIHPTALYDQVQWASYIYWTCWIFSLLFWVNKFIIISSFSFCYYPSFLK